MEIQERREGNVAVITLSGELDAACLPAVSAAVTRAVDEGRKQIVLNVRGVAIITSSAVGYVLKASNHLKADGGGLVISDPPAWFKRNIDTLGVTDMLTLVPDDEAALAALAG